MTRLVPFGGQVIGVGQAYGITAYGRIGAGVRTQPGTPQFQSALFMELGENIDAHAVYPYGVPAYGSWWVRAAVLAPPVEKVQLIGDFVSSPLLEESEAMYPVTLRVKSDRLIAYELVETD